MSRHWNDSIFSSSSCILLMCCVRLSVFHTFYSGNAQLNVFVVGQYLNGVLLLTCKILNVMLCVCSASDWTMYPFSTQNYQDYQNLMSVYLDAVFFPLLRHLDFW